MLLLCAALAVCGLLTIRYARSLPDFRADLPLNLAPEFLGATPRTASSRPRPPRPPRPPRSAAVRILLLDPDSLAARQCSAEIREDVRREQFQVRLHGAAPPIQFYRWGERMMVSFYPRRPGSPGRDSSWR